jgi:ABC-type multidrug transport system ATPase subunit
MIGSQTAAAAAVDQPIDTVRIRQLTKRYGRQRALAGIDLDLGAGSLCALIGANGAGKSTLLGIVSTLVRPSSGQVTFEGGGHPLPNRGNTLRRQIGVIAHESLLYGGLTALENLNFFGQLYQIADWHARARALLEEVGLEVAAWTRPASGYSRGMLQRLALARALLHQPRVLLLDEPFTGLDRSGSLALMGALERAQAVGCLVLVATHDLGAIAELTDHVAVLNRGRVVFEERRNQEDGFSEQELKDLYARYSSPGSAGGG